MFQKAWHTWIHVFPPFLVYYSQSPVNNKNGVDQSDPCNILCIYWPASIGFSLRVGEFKTSWLAIIGSSFQCRGDPRPLLVELFNRSLSQESFCFSLSLSGPHWLPNAESLKGDTEPVDVASWRVSFCVGTSVLSYWAVQQSLCQLFLRLLFILVVNRDGERGRNTSDESLLATDSFLDTVSLIGESASLLFWIKFGFETSYGQIIDFSIINVYKSAPNGF